MSHQPLFPLLQIEQLPPSLTWRIRRDVLYPQQPIDTMQLPDDANGIHFGLYVNHSLSGVVSLFMKDQVAQFRKFAVLKTMQKKGLGTVLLRHLIDYSKGLPLRSLWCNARVDARGFYEKFGFRVTSETYTIHEITYVKMELIIQAHPD